MEGTAKGVDVRVWNRLCDKAGPRMLEDWTWGVGDEDAALCLLEGDPGTARAAVGDVAPLQW